MKAKDVMRTHVLRNIMYVCMYVLYRSGGRLYKMCVRPSPGARTQGPTSPAQLFISY